MRILALVVLLATMPLAARAENPATIKYGCAPWDGQALVIKVGAPDAVYHLRLWANGIKALESVAHAVTVDNKQESSGLGTGSVCSTDVDGKTKCSQEALHIETTAKSFNAGDTISGTITFKDNVVPFIGTVAAHHDACG